MFIGQNRGTNIRFRMLFQATIVGHGHRRRDPAARRGRELGRTSLDAVVALVCRKFADFSRQNAELLRLSIINRLFDSEVESTSRF